MFQLHCCRRLSFLNIFEVSKLHIHSVSGKVQKQVLQNIESQNEFFATSNQRLSKVPQDRRYVRNEVIKSFSFSWNQKISWNFFNLKTFSFLTFRDI